jgi:5'-nucleotidase
MRILVTNDDGIHAPGLEACARIARALSDDVWVVAPEFDQSGVSHSLSLSDPLRLRQVEERRFAVKGTPTDCVIMAVRHIMMDARPDLVLSGVNRGQNVAEDVGYSGTVAGAIEGTVLGIPSMALSQSGWPTVADQDMYAPSEHFGPGIVRRLVELGWPKDVVININFPAVALDQITEVEVTRQTFRDINVRHAEKRTDLRNREYYWMGFRQNAPSLPKERTCGRSMTVRFPSPPCIST